MCESRCLGDRYVSVCSATPILGVVDAEYGLSDEIEGLTGAFFSPNIHRGKCSQTLPRACGVTFLSVSTDDIREI